MKNNNNKGNEKYESFAYCYLKKYTYNKRFLLFSNCRIGKRYTFSTVNFIKKYTLPISITDSKLKFNIIILIPIGKIN